MVFDFPAAKSNRAGSSETASTAYPKRRTYAGIATDVAVETKLATAHLDDIPAIAAMMRRFALPIEDVLDMIES